MKRILNASAIAFAVSAPAFAASDTSDMSTVEKVETMATDAVETVSDAASDAVDTVKTQSAVLIQAIEDQIDETTSDVVTIGENADYAIFDAPEIEIDGYSAASADDFTTDALIGAPLYDAEEKRIGEVDAIAMTPEGKVKGAVLGIGGILGIGEKDVLVSFESLTLKEQIGGEDMRVYADVTKEGLEAIPAFAVES